MGNSTNNLVRNLQLDCDSIKEKKQLNKVINVLYNSIFDKIPEPTLLIENDKIIRCNDAIVQLFGYTSKKEFTSKGLFELFPEQQLDGSSSEEKSLRYIHEALDKGVTTFEWIHKKKKGEQFYARIILLHLHIEGRKVIHAIVHDITEQKKNQEQIKYLTLKDSLTDLYNKSMFIETLNYELKKGMLNEELIAIIFITIDKFSIINNQFGYKFGDKILKNIADELNKIFLEGNTIARYGGDEFIVLLPHIKDNSDVISITKSVLKRIEYFCENIEKKNIDFTISMGIAISPKQNITSEELINNAHVAMTEAKKDRKSSYRLFNAMMKENLNATYIFENALSKALAHNQFFLMYQPIFEVETGKILGAEALLRWNHPEQGVISPQDFITITERNGSIIDIGEWVLMRVCYFIKKMQRMGHSPIPIAVNVSAVQLEEHDFVYKVKEILKETKIDPRYLELEITESTAMKDIQNIVQKLRQLKSLGIKLAIDDFGTGYSSLSQLHNLKVDKLKIDRSFIKNLDHDVTSKNITAAIMNIANTFNLVTVAEGIETFEQLYVLKELKATMFQGYLYAKPLRENYFIQCIEGL